MTEKKKSHKEIITVLASGEDKKKIVDAASVARLSVSSFCRIIILKSLKGESVSD